MDERIRQELELLRQRFRKIEYKEEGRWFRIPEYPLHDGWSRTVTQTAFQAPVGYAGTPPYGIYVPTGLLFNGAKPKDYTEPAPTQPPFPGAWGIFSWRPDDGQWMPTADACSGSNLLNWVIGFATRFQQGN